MGDKPVKSLQTIEYDRLTKFLKMLRVETRFTQKMLCQKLGYEKTYVSKIERGSRRIDFIEFRHYCQALGKDPSEMSKLFEEYLKEPSH